MVIALVVTPEGLPMAYEVLPGNTADFTTLRMFLTKIQDLYGRAAHLGDGSRHPHRSCAGRNARQRPAGAVSGGHAERPSLAAGEAPG